MKRVLMLISVLLPLCCYAQIDSSYIRHYPQKITIYPYLSKNLLIMKVESLEGEKSYMPNNPPNIGLGVAIKNTIIDLSYGYGVDCLRNSDKGKTTSFDFQLHSYGQKISVDLFVQKYHGFYTDEEGEIELYPGLKVYQYGIYGQYIFNNKRFSYKAAFNQSEKQLRSAGSFLVGFGAYKTDITSDDNSFVYNEKHSLHNFQFGVSGGYAYTWVVGRFWTISASGTAGLNVGCEKLEDFGKQGLDVYPTVFPRVSVAYNREAWALGLAYVGNEVFPSVSKGSSISLISGVVQLTFTKRLEKDLFKKKKNKTSSGVF